MLGELGEVTFEMLKLDKASVCALTFTQFTLFCLPGLF